MNPRTPRAPDAGFRSYRDREMKRERKKMKERKKTISEGKLQLLQSRM